MMDRRTFVAIFGFALLGLSPNLRAQGQVTMRRIGVLSPFARTDVEAFLSLLRPELEKLGWTDGRNIVLLAPRTTGATTRAYRPWPVNWSRRIPTSFSCSPYPPLVLSCSDESIPIVMFGVGTPSTMGSLRTTGSPAATSPARATSPPNTLASSCSSSRRRLLACGTSPSSPIRATRRCCVCQTTAGGRRRLRDGGAGSGSFTPGRFWGAFMAIRRANTESILLPPEALIQSNRDAIAGFAQTHGLPLAVVATAVFFRQAV